MEKQREFEFVNGKLVLQVKEDLRIVKYLDEKYGVEFNPNNDPLNHKNDWTTMGGSVGFGDSIFSNLVLAQTFVIKGLAGELKGNLEIWLEMLEIS